MTKSATGRPARSFRSTPVRMEMARMLPLSTLGSSVVRPRARLAGLLAALVVVGLPLGLGSAPVAAQEATPPVATTAAPLAERTYADLGCAVSLPESWKETRDGDSIRYEIDAFGSSGLLKVWTTRKSLARVIQGLEQRAEKQGWTTIEADRKELGPDGEWDAYVMVVDAAVKGGPGGKVRNLFLVFDAPSATYLLHVGMQRERFDDALMQRVCESFRSVGDPARPTDAAPGAPPPSAPSDAEAPPPADAPPGADAPPPADPPADAPPPGR